MENAKQKAIRLAYLTELSKDKVDKKAGLKFYNELKKYIDENGWINANECNGTSGYLMESKLDFNFPYLRLQSLQGIETNNNWIKIDEIFNWGKNNEYLIFWDSERNESIVSLKYALSEYQDSDYKKRFTHYQPIVKPLKPIY